MISMLLVLAASCIFAVLWAIPRESLACSAIFFTIAYGAFYCIEYTGFVIILMFFPYRILSALSPIGFHKIIVMAIAAKCILVCLKRLRSEKMWNKLRDSVG